MLSFKPLLLATAIASASGFGAVAQTVKNMDFEQAEPHQPTNARFWRHNQQSGVAVDRIRFGDAGNHVAAFFSNRPGTHTSTLWQAIKFDEIGVYSLAYDWASKIVGDGIATVKVTFGNTLIDNFTIDGSNSSETMTARTAMGQIQVSDITDAIRLKFSVTTQYVKDHCGCTSSSKFYLDNIMIANRNPPVPGPVAGAGLPVLLAGGALWWTRRRKAA